MYLKSWVCGEIFVYLKCYKSINGKEGSMYKYRDVLFKNDIKRSENKYM